MTGKLPTSMRSTGVGALVAVALAAACIGAAPAGRHSSDTPAGFTYRGVIEGFYGPPWPQPERLSFLSWMAGQGFNVYIHAPKADPYQRLRWREPYPPEQLRQFGREIALASAHGMAWVPSISPGLPLLEAADDHDTDICFSCANDRTVLFDKLDAFVERGARTLMVSFDNVVKASTHPEDAAAYGVGDRAYGVMTADLLNRVYAHYAHQLGEDFRLLTVPADYFGTTTTPYLEGFGATLRPEIGVMWTGPAVISPTITCDQAAGYARAVGRDPILWDNFPVNDTSPDKLIVGPYAGRARDLPSCLEGIVANPASQIRANRIPLATVADYLRDPAHYDEEASWRRSLEAFAGDQVDLLLPFIDNVRSTALDRTEAPRFTARRDAFLQTLDTPGWPNAASALVTELEREQATPQRLRQQFRDQAFIAELDCAFATRQEQYLTARDQVANGTCAGSWLDRLAFNAVNGLETTRILTRTRPDVTAMLRDGVLSGAVRAPVEPTRAARDLDTLRGMSRRDDGNPANVHGDRYYVALGPTWVDENRMDAYFDAAVRREAAYLPFAARASATIRLTLDGRAVPLDDDGRFAIPFGRDRATLVVTDGAGHTTRRTVVAG